MTVNSQGDLSGDQREQLQQNPGDLELLAAMLDVDDDRADAADAWTVRYPDCPLDQYDVLRLQRRGYLTSAGVATIEYDAPARPSDQVRTWRIPDRVREVVADIAEQRRERGGWCTDEDCYRTAIDHAEEGPRCKCGAELREEVME